MRYVRKTRIRKSRQHGHWMVFHGTGYSQAHPTFPEALNDAIQERARLERAMAHLWRKVPGGYVKDLSPTVLPSKPKKNVATTSQNQTIGYREAVRIRDGRICHYCGKKGNTLDHVVPQSKGGPNKVDNLVMACSKCNGDKGDSRGSCLCDFCCLAWQTYGWTLF